MPKESTIEWEKITEDERDLIDAIVDRYRLWEREFVKADQLEMTTTQITHLTMDIAAAHTKCPLDLKRLLGDFDDANFLHDVAGIRMYIDRNTGELKECFLPRCAK